MAATGGQHEQLSTRTPRFSQRNHRWRFVFDHTLAILRNAGAQLRGLPGVIHAPALSAPYFTGSHVVYKDSDRIWKTDFDTKVSFGNYAGEGPTGQAASSGTAWVYITGQVAVWRTPDDQLFLPPLGQVINRSTNLIETIMEREYVISYDCYAAGVEVTLDTTDQ